LDPEWLTALPGRLGLDGVGVQIQDVRRGELACKKVDFDIPPQPHGRHIAAIRAIVARSDAPPHVRERADQAFLAIATVEGAIHGVSPERVHLHEVGAVDAILDVLGSIWGFDQLGVDEVYCLPLSLGDGTVEAAHGTLPVPAPATLELLEGHVVQVGPPGSGELVTPTGAALVRVLSRGAPPPFVPVRTGYGAGTKEFPRRANALRLILATSAHVSRDGGTRTDGTERETLVTLATDVDDMTGEYLAHAADTLRGAGALDVVLLPTLMKKGRPGTRLEVLARPRDADRLESLMLMATTSIGVRRWSVSRRALERRDRVVLVHGHQITVKEVTLPDGTLRAKPDYDAVIQAADATGRPASDIFLLAAEAARTHDDLPPSGLPGARSTPDGGPVPDHVPHLVRSRSQV
jgi:pyridinium-3,5-bisthiocarboxylic acid mononucleotide nickel chelatase